MLERSQVLFECLPGSRGASETSEGTYLSMQLCKHLQQHKRQAQSFASACNKPVYDVGAPARTWLGACLHRFLVLHRPQKCTDFYVTLIKVYKNHMCYQLVYADI